MKVSLNWIRELTGVKTPTGELIDLIGQQLGEAEEVIDLSSTYAGTIVKVVSCTPIEGTHLNLCLIDDNKMTKEVNRQEGGLIQVVCGAPNVKAAMLAVWLAPGTTVPSTAQKEPFVLEAKELRGHISNGMLASSHELALTDDHEGILEITDNLNPGDSFAESYGLNDIIVDIENKMFTHRPDCFGELGVAREISGITKNAFTSPDWYLTPNKLPELEDSLKLEVDNELPKLVPRFTSIALSNVDGGKKSPLWLQTLLVRLGIKPISLIVDITNYMMIFSAQPLHAYDYNKVKELSGGEVAKLIVRNPKPDEQIELLDGKTVKPTLETIMIAAPDKPLALAGIKGGKDTEVTAETKNIIIECASFDMYTVRRSSMALGQFSDASTRFTKGQSPLQQDRVIAKTVEMLVDLAGAKVASDLIDINNTELVDTIHPAVKVSTSFVNARLGLELSANEIASILSNVEFRVEINNDDLQIKAPFWRSDIELAEDIVEEVGRLYGFQHLPLKLPVKDISPPKLNPELVVKNKIRKVLASAGANELLTYSFVHENVLKAANQDKDNAFALSNALSPDLQYYRMSVVPSLLDKVHPNIKSGNKDFVLFELSPIHLLGEMDKNDTDVPAEFQHLGLVVASDDKNTKSEYEGAPYYQAQTYLYRLMTQLNVYFKLVPVDIDRITPGFKEAIKTYEAKRSALIVVNDKVIGIIGEPIQSTKRSMKLPGFVAMFELDIDDLIANMLPRKYFELSHYPKVEQDICFKVENDLPYQKLMDFCYEFISSKKDSDSYFYISTLDIYQSDEDASHKQITFRLSLNSYTKTMTDKEISTLLSLLGDAARKELGASVV